MGGGRGFRAARMLASGDLQLIVLVLLEERPRHGYDIIKELEERSSGIYAPSPGVVYPALTYLEEVEYAVAEAEGNKKLYAITDAGKAYLAKNRAVADETLEQLARFGRKMARFQREYADEEDIRNDFGTDPRGEARREWRHFRSQFREIWGDMRDTLREKLEAPMEEKERIYQILKKALEEIRKKP
ncbi:MAG TPA: PadR family transcriptional regulator [Anaeromyxobacteraceae bacterium]|nr:PadR family transcriptional regulator [Anaeromyxobacteraceae bacterium]